MPKKNHGLTLFVAMSLLIVSSALAEKKKDNTEGAKGESTAIGTPVLWREPTDITSRNLLYGPGGVEHQPKGPFTFLKEDLDGTNPKFEVKDADGVKWKVKMGEEARPETVSTRLVWAVGYFANEDYFLTDFRAEQMPPHLKRGQNLVGPDGTIHNVRLKRYLKGEKKTGIWKWRENPFTGTRELNGLRVMMALINNWDLKDVNNAVYREKHGDDADGATEVVYMVTDLGASFGTTGESWSHAKGKGNIGSYAHSQFIAKVKDDLVDFNGPTRPAVIVAFNPHEFVSRLNLRWIGKEIPKADVKWISGYLAQLSADQIKDAFRAAGYSALEVDEFAVLLTDRIAELKNL
jgi:hypothetical protein